eukprot:1137162-Pelagomonas_calceolata.AAC.3
MEYMTSQPPRNQGNHSCPTTGNYSRKHLKAHTIYRTHLTLPETCKSRVACVYNAEGKCVGMITPERYDVLFKAFHKSKAEGLYDSICPPPASFASEILGLLARKIKLEDK